MGSSTVLYDLGPKSIREIYDVRGEGVLGCGINKNNYEIFPQKMS